MPGGADLRHALHVFIHDLRAPISVAMGFARLLRDGRLPDEESRARALVQTTDALGRLSGLCDAASDLLGVVESPEPPTERCRLDHVAAAVKTALAAEGVQVEDSLPMPAGATIWAARADLLASRVAAVAAMSRRNSRDADLVARLDVADGWFRVLIGPAPVPEALVRGAAVGLESGRGVSLPVLVACLDIARHGGRAWTTDDAWPAVGVALPVQENPS